MSVLNRFIKYTTINTTTISKAGKLPSNPKEFELAQLIAEELRVIGLVDIEISDNCILTASLPANTKEECPRLMFSSHLDTSYEQTTDTYAQVHKNYQGGDIILNKEKNILLSPKKFPELEDYIGQDIITTDGTSLLGADDKAGIAAIVEGLKILVETPEIKHGEIKVAFLPDEEQGLCGAKAFDKKDFADVGFVFDAGGVGEYSIENWNADEIEITFRGVTAHPISAKGTMINSLLIAHDFISRLPKLEVPEHTEGKEGYFWVTNLQGNTGKTVLNIDIREFDLEKRKQRHKFLNDLIAEFKNKHGDNAIEGSINSVYSNVGTYLAPFPFMEDLIEKSMKNLDITPIKISARGGYDGSVLSEKGIPCPNIFAGAHNFHSIYEFLPLQSLEKATLLVSELAKMLFIYSQNK